MSEGTDQIILLIMEEAGTKEGHTNFVSALYDTKLEIDLMIGEIMLIIRDHEKRKAQKRGGE